jgi:hypothetical protein
VPTVGEGITEFSVKCIDTITTSERTDIHTAWRRRTVKSEKIQTDRLYSQIFVNIISQQCEHVIGEYSL